MQSKTTMKYHLTLGRMVFMKNTRIKSTREYVKKREPLYTVGKNVNWYSYQWIKFLRKLKTELPWNPATLILTLYPKEMKSLPQRDICTPILVVALFTVAKAWKQQKSPSTDEGRKWNDPR